MRKQALAPHLPIHRFMMTKGKEKRRYHKQRKLWLWYRLQNFTSHLRPGAILQTVPEPKL